MAAFSTHAKFFAYIAETRRNKTVFNYYQKTTMKSSTKTLIETLRDSAKGSLEKKILQQQSGLTAKDMKAAISEATKQKLITRKKIGIVKGTTYNCYLLTEKGHKAELTETKPKAAAKKTKQRAAAKKKK